MRSERLWKRLLGLATFGCPISAITLVAWLAFSPFMLSAGAPPEYPKDQLLYFALGTFATVLLGAVTLVTLALTTLFYAVHILRNERLSRTGKIVWSLLNVPLGLFAMPAYWYRFVGRVPTLGEPGKR